MSLTIVNRNDNSIVGEISNKNGLISAMYRRKKENDEMSLDIELVYTDSHMIRKGNSVVIEDEEGKLREFDIDDYEEIDGEVVVASCLPTYINDLGLSKPISKSRNLNSLATEELLNSLLSETIWQSGAVYSAGSLPFERDNHEHPLVLIQRLAEQRQLVADYYVEIGFGRVTSRKVDLRLPEVIDNGKEIRRGKDLTSLKRRESLVDTRTAVQVIGKRTHTGIDSDGKEVEIETELVVEVFNDEIQNKIGRPGDYKWEVIESESNNEEDMRVEGNKHLQQVSKVYEEFEVDVEDLSSMFPHETVQFGDVVHIKDTRYEPVLTIKGEIVEVEYDISDESTKKYLVGEAVKKKTKIEDLREVVDTHSNRIGEVYEFQRDVREKFNEIGTPINRGDLQVLEYKNLFRFSDFRAGVGSTLHHFDYDTRLEVISTSQEEYVSEATNFPSDYYSMFRIEKDMEWMTPYTIRFEVRGEGDLFVMHPEHKIIYQREDGVDIGNDRREYSVNTDEWKTYEVVYVKYFFARENPITHFTFSNTVGGATLEFRDFKMYKGTPKYSVESEFQNTDIVKGEYTTVPMEISGGTAVFDNRDEGAEWGFSDFAEVLLRNATTSPRLMNIKMKVKVEVEDSSGFSMQYTPRYFDGGGIYVGTSDDSWVEEVDNTWDYTNGSYLIKEDNPSYPYEFDLDAYLEVEPGTGDRFGLSLTVNSGVTARVELSNIRVFEGKAPEGVAVEGEGNSSGTNIVEKIEGIQEGLEGKADKSHKHDIEDINGMEDVALSDEVKDMNWEIDSILGLNTSLGGKSDVGHTHLISEIDGLQNVIDLLVDNAGNGGNGEGGGDVGAILDIISQLEEISEQLQNKADIDHVHYADEIVNLEDYINQGGGEISQRYEVVDIIDYGNYQEIVYFDNDWGMQYTFTNEKVSGDGGSGAQYEVVDIIDYGDSYEVVYLDTNWGEVFNITIPKDGSGGGNGGTEQPQYEIIMVDEKYDSTDLYIDDNYNDINHIISVSKNSGGGGGSGGRYSVTGITDLSYSKSIQFIDNELGENVTLSIPTDGSMVSGFDFMMYKRDMTRQLNILRAELGLEPIEEEGPGGGPAGPGGGPASS